MSDADLTARVTQLLRNVQKLVATPGMTWIDANNAVYGPRGLFMLLFPTKADRQAFCKNKLGWKVDELIDSLSDLPDC